MGSIPGQGPHRSQPMSAHTSGTTSWCFSLPRPTLFLKSVSRMQGEQSVCTCACVARVHVCERDGDGAFACTSPASTSKAGGHPGVELRNTLASVRAGRSEALALPPPQAERGRNCGFQTTPYSPHPKPPNSLLGPSPFPFVLPPPHVRLLHGPHREGSTPNPHPGPDVHLP